MSNSFQYGVIALENNRYTVAKKFFLQSINEKTRVVDSYFNLGKCQFLCTENSKAIVSLNTCIELASLEKEDMKTVYYAWDLLGQCYEAQNNPTKALECYETATKIDPDNASAWHNMGAFYIKKSEEGHSESKLLFEKAYSFLKKALEICCEDPKILNSMAGWYNKCIEILENTLEAEEEIIQQQITNHYINAIKCYRNALKMCKKNSMLENIISQNFNNCLSQYGDHLYRNKNYKEAQEIYLEVIHLDPKCISAINQMGMCLSKQDNFAEARKYFSSILDIATEKQDLADAKLNIACIYRLEKNWSQARKALNEAKELAPEDSSIAEEESKLESESKTTHEYVYSPQTFFGSSVNVTKDSINELQDSYGPR